MQELNSEFGSADPSALTAQRLAIAIARDMYQEGVMRQPGGNSDEVLNSFMRMLSLFQEPVYTPKKLEALKGLYNRFREAKGSDNAELRHITNSPAVGIPLLAAINQLCAEPAQQSAVDEAMQSMQEKFGLPATSRSPQAIVEQGRGGRKPGTLTVAG